MLCFLYVPRLLPYTRVLDKKLDIEEVAFCDVEIASAVLEHALGSKKAQDLDPK